MSEFLPVKLPLFECPWLMTEEMQEFGGLQHLYIYLSPQTVILAYFPAFDPALDPMFDVFTP